MGHISKCTMYQFASDFEDEILQTLSYTQGSELSGREAMAYIADTLVRLWSRYEEEAYGECETAPRELIDATRDEWQSNDLQIDLTAKTVTVPEGTWVQAWVWMPKEITDAG